MKLYELPRGSFFKLLEENPYIPPDSNDYSTDDIFKFIKIDGMYSLCFDEHEIPHHFAAWTEVTPYEPTTVSTPNHV